MSTDEQLKQLEAAITMSGTLLGRDDLKFSATATLEEGAPPSFDGKLDDEAARVSLSELANALLPEELQLPPELPDLVLSNLAFTLKPHTGEFSFSSGAALGLGAFSLFGVNFSLPDIDLDVQLVGEKKNGTLKVTLSIGLTIDAHQAFTASSSLAWIRDLGALFREVQNDEKDRPQDVVRLEIKPLQKTRLTLLRTTLGEPTSTAYLTGFQAENGSDDPKLELSFVLDATEAFEFPFLKADAVEGIASALSQSISLPEKYEHTFTVAISASETDAPEAAPAFGPPDNGDLKLNLDVPLNVQVGDIEFGSKIPIDFNLSKFAVDINDEEGIQLMADEKEISHKLLGLTWTFRGQQAGSRHHYFTLVTKNFDYQLQLAPEAFLDLSYGEISQEPIVFRVSDFVLAAKGLTLAAEILDNPVRLNGLDTKFRFEGSRLHIVENVIQDLTIRGAGPLPPDLVGDAVADIALQFKQVDGGLRLVSGAAQLRGEKPLDCRGTRFQFSIDAMGLKFVYDQRFHLYFTITGAARFVPEASDDTDGPLALLPKVELELVECPLTGDASVIAKHISFLIEMPKPISFSFLGAYGFELRAIGFQPQSEKVGGRGAMILSGQVMFAQGKGDQADPKPDFHKLYIGLPPQGETAPVVAMDTLPVTIKMGEQFKLSGSVAFVDNDTMQGFTGDGVLEITGLPSMAAAFGFMRVRRDANSAWVRAWFIYLEVRQISFQIPVLSFYIREVGLGFGYRFTIVAIKRADEAGDIKQLIRELKVLSRTQGDLSKQDRWAVDLEGPGQDPRWTIVLRAMISQLSAAPSPLTWNAKKERELSNVYLFDAIIAVRSDLTFLMSVRGWLNTSYGTYAQARSDKKDLAPLVSGFVLLSVRQKRFLAHLASNPEGHLGTSEYPLKPTLPEFLVRALRNIEVSATLLIEPGLMHFELGWPNMLRWSDSLGPLSAELRGGFIFRISSAELLIGVSFLARARLEISASVNLGLVGASLSALAEAAYGARYMALIPFDDRSLAMYGAIGLELRVRISLSLWIKIPLLFTTIKLSFSFSFEIGFTAGLEVALHGTTPGLRGQGTISLSVMGHSLQFGVKLGVNEDAVTQARLATERYMQIGLEATDVETALPGVDGAGAVFAAPFAFAALDGEAFHAPNYSIFTIRGSESDEYTYFVLLPRAETDDGVQEPGFLPVPPANDDAWQAKGYSDFRLELPTEIATLEQFNPHKKGAESPWEKRVEKTIEWAAYWKAPISEVDEEYVYDDPPDYDKTPHRNENPSITGLTLRQYLRQAFIVQNENDNNGDNNATLNDVTPSDDVLPIDDVTPIGDPEPIYTQLEQLEDDRVQNPSDSAFEAAVRGAVEQFRGSPFFKHDPNLAYDKALEEAFHPDNTVYAEDGKVPGDEDARATMEGTEQAHQIRSLVIHDLINDVREFVAPSDDGQAKPVEASIPFQMGLVFRMPVEDAPDWLHQDAGSLKNGEKDLPRIYQRYKPEHVAPGKLAGEVEPSEEEERLVETFNLDWTDFAANPPQFQRVQHFTDANTIAIAWDLEWEGISDPGDTRTQPEHHLQSYQVRRRPLDGRTPEVVYQVKNASALHREGDGPLKRLKPRFQVVDHFNQETLEQQAGLPATGRSYLYTITPVDFADKKGQPLTLVATRYPNEPPQVPVDGELAIEHHLLLDEAVTPAGAPQVVEPVGLQVTWTEPSNPKDGPRVAVSDYLLVFRREATLPIGSYGLDSSTQRARTGLLPTSNARALPTDIKVVLSPTGPRGKRVATHAKLLTDGPGVKERSLLEVLRQAGVFPEGPENSWRPESWRVFFQTVSSNQVPSALAPVQLLLRVSSPDPEIAEVEERHPSELEWLPKPIRLPMLPPEDQRAVAGTAHFPMPVDGQFHFEASLGNVKHQVHPLGLRCIRLRWNQGPSGQPDYPLNLTAGYDLLELDVDAHTGDTFRTAESLEQAVRPIQEVQMLPAEDLWLAPGDTLTANQWEAWYPSALVRRRAPEIELEGAESEESPWYSWRDSLLEWPSWILFTDRKRRAQRPDDIHHDLKLIPYALALMFSFEFPGGLSAGPLSDGLRRQLVARGLTAADGETWTAFEPEPGSELWEVKNEARELVCRIVQREDQLYAVASRSQALNVEGDYTVDLQASPPFQPQDYEGFLQSTDPENDPYGWSVLQRLGLAVAMSLRHRADGELIVGQDLLDLLEVALAYVRSRRKGILKYLHVELLFQPGRCVELSKTSASSNALLGFVQLSLRPAIKQVLRYRRVEVQGPAGKEAHLVFTFAKPFSLVNQADPAGGQTEMEPDETAPQTMVKRAIILPANKVTNLLLRGAQLPTVQLDPDKTEENEGMTISADETFHPTHPFATYFTQSVEDLASTFAHDEEARRQWIRFQRYAEALTPPGSEEPHIEVKADEAGLKEQLPAFLAWAQRFFDASAPVEVADDDLAQTGDGPWLATAYPRVATPALVAPGPGGRLAYDHLLQDKWAHNYRYYVRPYDRYRLLWQSLLKSPKLSPKGGADVEVLAEAQPDPEAGGLDVVLDRTQPVDMPLVLNSARLDPPGQPGQPVAPGRTWEVIVAQHAEQSLIERNQTLARRLAFRQTAFSLLRYFAHDDWVPLLEGAVETPEGVAAHKIQLKLVENHLPGSLPDGYPEQPEQIVFDAGSPLPDDVVRSLDLPQRIGSFQQGALVLQWEALPFFYKHRLLLVAQTASTVSPVNEVTQSDFEYRSPDLFDTERVPAWQALVEGQQLSCQVEIVTGQPREVVGRGRSLQLPLHRFWDCLPPESQAQWPAEAPSPEDGQQRKPGSLPDPEVVYQIVEIVDGNIEVQAEIYFDRTAKPPRYAVRQLGRRILVCSIALAPPGEPQDDYVLHLTLQQLNQVILEGEIDMGDLEEGTQAKVFRRDSKLLVAGVLSAEERDDILEALAKDPNAPETGSPDRQKIEALYQGWYCQEPISRPADLEQLPERFEDLGKRVDFPESGEKVSLIRHHGVMTRQEAQALRALFELPEDRAAVERLYACSVSKGLHGSEITIMARRGGAAPSDMRPLEALPLEDG